jgi:hypothetical protein
MSEIYSWEKKIYIPEEHFSGFYSVARNDVQVPPLLEGAIW